MILIIREGCDFCKDLKPRLGLLIAKFISGDPPQIEVEGHRMPPPLQLPGLPALLDGEKLYVGRQAVLERLEGENETAFSAHAASGEFR
jgi:hypothetical protein